MSRIRAEPAHAMHQDFLTVHIKSSQFITHTAPGWAGVTQSSGHSAALLQHADTKYLDGQQRTPSEPCDVKPVSQAPRFRIITTDLNHA